MNNKHFLYVKGCATSDQIEACISNAATEYRNDISLKLEVNCVSVKNVPLPIQSFVWVKDERLFNLLMGLNLDGSERYEYVPDPDWKPTIVPEEILTEQVLGRSWVEMVEEEEEELKRDQPPLIRKELPPLITLPEITYNSEQRSYIKPSGNTFTIKIQPARPPEVPSHVCSYRLRAKVFGEISEKEIYQAIRHYSSSEKHVKQLSSNKSERQLKPYPHVNLKNNVAYVEFDPQSSDGLYAIHMMKRLNIHIKNKKTQTLFFDYC